MDLKLAGPALVPVGVIIAAVIAGYLSYTSLISSKEQKISEFRQQWIDALRTSIAEYLAALSLLSFLYKDWWHKSHPDGSTFAEVKEVQETYLRIDKAYNDIILRINPNETDQEGKRINDDFLQALDTTREHYNKGEYLDAGEACKGVRDAGKPLLKFEWNRVKRGEPANDSAKKWASRILVIVAVVAVLLFICLVFTAISPAGNPSISHP